MGAKFVQMLHRVPVRVCEPPDSCKLLLLLRLAVACMLRRSVEYLRARATSQISRACCYDGANVLSDLASKTMKRNRAK